MEELTVVVFYMEETWGRAGKRTPWHSRSALAVPDDAALAVSCGVAGKYL